MDEIEKNVPLPVRLGGRNNPIIQAIGRAEVGDSILCDLGQNKKNIRATARYHYPHIKLVMRTVKDGIRIWRAE